MTPAPDFEETRAVTPSAAGELSLPAGTRLNDYEIAGVIAESAFGIVYLARDAVLQREVAIAEYLPTAIATRSDDSAAVVTHDRHLDTFKAGLASFLQEARQLAGFDHPSLLKVYRHWEENGTAYRAMPHLAGPTLRAALGELGHVPSEGELRAWLKPVLDAVTALHAGRVWHQDISPDSIVMTPGGPVLLGFASAAHAIEASHHTPAVALRPGFAAIEQYGSEAGTTRGPWTDLYALAATVYAAITGADPAPAADRLAHDSVRPLAVVAAGLYSPGFLAAIDAAMAIQPQQRPADHAEFRALMGDIEAPASVGLAPRRNLMQEPFLPPADEGREVTVPDPPRPVAAEAAPVPAAPAPAAAAAAAALPARTAATAGAGDATGTDRAAPSWMSGTASPRAGRRVLYGVVAGACVLIGLVALALQNANRAAPGEAGAASASASARPPTQVPRQAPTQASITASNAAAMPPATAPPRKEATASAPAAAVPPSPAPITAPVRAAPAPVPAPASAAPVTAADSQQRQSRCLDILQRASLETISAADTEFFKRQCK